MSIVLVNLLFCTVLMSIYQSNEWRALLLEVKYVWIGFVILWQVPFYYILRSSSSHISQEVSHIIISQ
jgi:hypothetical protein